MNHIGRAATFTALGREWTLARWTRSIWFDIIEHAKTILPDPRKDAEEILKILPESDTAARVQVVKDALEVYRRMFVIGSPELNAFLCTEEGSGHSIMLLLKPNHPDITRDVVFEIISEVGDSPQFQDAVKRSAGVSPPKESSPGDGGSGAVPTT